MSREKGVKNRGYFWRDGRGWSITHNGSKLLLRDENGEALPKTASNKVILDARARLLATFQVKPADRMTVGEVCRIYIERCRKENRDNTIEMRHKSLFDFCSGFPARFKDCPEKPEAKHRLHRGFKDLLVSELKPLHLREWFEAHKGWSHAGNYRIAVGHLKGAFSWAVAQGIINANPLTGVKQIKGNTRPTYFTPEQQTAIQKFASPALALAFRTMIRTGARMDEFCILCPRHVQFTGDGMTWNFKPAEVKTNSIRTIYTRDAELIAYCKSRMQCGGNIFVNSHGRPWNSGNLRACWKELKKKLIAAGVQMEGSERAYSCRHTFAKEVLSGRYSGYPTTIQNLARLMGNSVRVCEQYYLCWSSAHTKQLWDVV